MAGLADASKTATDEASCADCDSLCHTLIVLTKKIAPSCKLCMVVDQLLRIIMIAKVAFVRVKFTSSQLCVNQIDGPNSHSPLTLPESENKHWLPGQLISTSMAAILKTVEHLILYCCAYSTTVVQMSQQGAALQSYNNELVKCKFSYSCNF